MSIEITRLSQYIETIGNLQKHYPVLGNPSSKSFLFRGLCDYEYSLIPRIFHMQQDSVPGEDRVIENFTYSSLANEMNLLMSFIQDASGYLNIPPDDLLRWAEYAQHYGVPTRFLDWTGNPLAALYFSCKDKKDQDGTVWLLHKTNYVRLLSKEHHDPKTTLREMITKALRGESEIELPLLYTPYYVDSRMSAQESLFMVWGTEDKSLNDVLKDDCYYMKLPANSCGIREYGTEQQQALLFKFHIPAYAKQLLLRELDLVGINEKMLFPGLDGIGRYIERRFRFDYNEYIESI